MMFEDRFFVHKNLNRQKLVDYGFALQEDGFAYVVPVMQGEFDLHIHIGLNGDVQSKMVERDTGEEYVLYRTESATGSFVGEARRECANVLDDIAKKCYDKCNFQTKQSGELIAYVRARYGDELEFLWDKFPYDAIWRRRDTKKWYAIIMTVSAAKLGLEREGCSILNISSMNAYTPLTKIPAYSGAKAAVSNFTQWLAVHFSHIGIRVNAIAPGFFSTKQNEKLLWNGDGTPTARTGKILAATPMGRFGVVNDLVGATLFLVSPDAASFVTGVCIPIDGGFSSYSGV